ncbi:10361_t:CDS:2 [Gigaspora margarita]|uniref:10361_t:CDS:1 n=1 Tax=Gigaspora margarita TaxID=4874 RepID=A0ABN7VQX3_GIGMA|nr:10361_t:CDS:2 [Gigaspora margarita]
MLTKKLTPEEKMELTNTKRLQMHKLRGHCYVVIRMDSLLNYEIVDLSALAEMIMVLEDLKIYNKATNCWIYKGPFIKLSPEVLQQFEEAKYRLLELKK